MTGLIIAVINIFVKATLSFADLVVHELYKFLKYLVRGYFEIASATFRYIYDGLRRIRDFAR